MVHDLGDQDTPLGPHSPPGPTLAHATRSSTTSAPSTSLGFRVDELALARLVDDGFEEGQEALGRLRSALELLERREMDCSTDEAALESAPGDVYSMMLAIERQTARVERGLGTLSCEALRIVSSAIVEVDGGAVGGLGGIDDRVSDHPPGQTPRDGER